MPISPKRILAFAAIQVLVLVFLGFWLWRQNQPVALPDAILGADGRMQCVSYAPYYRPGESPFVAGYRANRERVEADLRLLARQFACVRTYTVDQGLEYVPELAGKFGLEVLLGAWIGRDPSNNEAELNRAIELANRYPEVVRGLIVGNEVLLRRDQTEAAMHAYLARAKAQAKVPVTYADVWEFWRKHKALEADVDFVTVHMLPYWEDEPQAIGAAIAHVEALMQRLSVEFRKPLLIGETGWPSRGKEREGAEPGLVNEARYLREFLRAAAAHGWRYNIVEAFDQPWKRVLEGTVGGYWGIIDSDLAPKFPLTGLVAEREEGLGVLLMPGVGVVALILLSLLAGLRNAGRLAGLGAFGAAYGVTAYLQLEYLQYTCRNPLEFAAFGSMAAAGLVLALALPALMAGRVRPNWSRKPWSRALAMTRRLFLFGAAVETVLLAADSRYRDFPLALFFMPALELGLCLPLLGIRWPGRPAERILAPVLALGGMISWAEDWSNPYAALWCLVCLLTSIAAGSGRGNVEDRIADLREPLAEPMGAREPAAAEN
jgi:exo-beta-1,3-glucanase (GH17 family)